MKPCTHPDCDGLIRAERPSRLKLRKYCSHKCALAAGKAAKLRGQDDAAIARAVRRILGALELPEPPSAALVRVVRQIRSRAYKSGYMCIRNKMQRAVKRGLLIHRSAALERVPGCRAGAPDLGARRDSASRLGTDARPHLKEIA